MKRWRIHFKSPGGDQVMTLLADSRQEAERAALAAQRQRHQRFPLTFARMSSGLTEYEFTVQAFVALNADTGPQILLDELLDETSERSLCAAVESDPTLGGLSEDVYCSEAQPARFLVTVDNRALLTSDWTVTVYVDGST